MMPITMEGDAGLPRAQRWTWSPSAVAAAVFAALGGTLLWASVARAEAAFSLTDGDTLVLNGTTYRLHGIDAPEPDQTCIDDHGQPWKCGMEARKRLAEFIGNRAVVCEKMHPDPVYPKRRWIGRCSVDGVSLNEWLVREGWAVDFFKWSNHEFRPLEEEAKSNRRGIWTGCFVRPDDLRTWNKSRAEILNASLCPGGASTSTRDILFPDHADMPSGCPIKGNVRKGIYHMEGCRSYRKLQTVNRWFCSENDAIDANLRKAINCGRR